MLDEVWVGWEGCGCGLDGRGVGVAWMGGVWLGQEVCCVAWVYGRGVAWVCGRCGLGVREVWLRCVGGVSLGCVGGVWLEWEVCECGLDEVWLGWDLKCEWG